MIICKRVVTVLTFTERFAHIALVSNYEYSRNKVTVVTTAPVFLMQTRPKCGTARFYKNLGPTAYDGYCAC